jgi:hypothetical protein
MPEKDGAEPRGVTRRKFLKTSAAGAATVAAGGCVAVNDENTQAVVVAGAAPAFLKKIEPSDTINVAYIGVGVRGRQHMR